MILYLAVWRWNAFSKCPKVQTQWMELDLSLLKKNYIYIYIMSSLLVIYNYSTTRLCPNVFRKLKLVAKSPVSLKLHLISREIVTCSPHHPANFHPPIGKTRYTHPLQHGKFKENHGSNLPRYIPKS